jgi:hypothetical protein
MVELQTNFSRRSTRQGPGRSLLDERIHQLYPQLSPLPGLAETVQGSFGFFMVGVHTPEFDSEKDPGRLKDRLAKNRLTFAVAVDNSAATWRAWNNRYWPAIYLVDKQGRVHHHWDGELGAEGFKTVTDQIDALLAEK